MKDKTSKKDKRLMFYGILIALIIAVGLFSYAIWTLEIYDINYENKTSKSGYCIENDIWNLKDCVLISNGDLEEIKNKEVDFTDISNSGLYSAEDNYGISYYFRGDKESIKNNLIFAGFQWKIIRINGDGSIRLLYNGVCPDNSCSINSEGVATTLVTESFFSGDLLYNNAEYLRYEYSETNSNLKTNLETWYAVSITTQNENILNKIADNAFCNDLSYISDSRLIDRVEPTLKCELNYSYTNEKSEYGNGLLTYPIGLITADEIVMAGNNYEKENKNNYLYIAQSYWTMTPQYFNTEAIAFGYDSLGYLTGYRVDETLYLRPVISLKSDVILSYGDGSTANPYIVN